MDLLVLGVALVAFIVILVLFLRLRARVALSVSEAVSKTREELLGEKNNALVEQKEELEDETQRRIKASNKKSLTSQRGKILGEALQRFIPWMPEFSKHYDPDDVIPLKDSVMDYLVLVGRGSGNITEIVLADVKSGSSTPSTAQSQVLSAIREGRIRGEVWHLDVDEGILLITSESGQKSYTKEKTQFEKKNSALFLEVARLKEEGIDVTFSESVREATEEEENE